MPLPTNQNLPEAALLDLQKRKAAMLRGGTPELLREAGAEMYNNPAVNTAMGLTPGVGDAMAGAEALNSLREGNYGEAGLNALGMLPVVPALGTMMRRGPDIVEQRLLGMLEKHGGDPEAAVNAMMQSVYNTPKRKTEIREQFLRDIDRLQGK